MSDDITYLTDVALMTCVVKLGMSEPILKAARDVGVVTGAVSYHCRGHGARERFGLLGIAIEAEKEIISMMVSREQQDTVFEALHRAGEMDVSGNGYVYCTPLEKMAIYIPKDMIDKLEDKK
jgi:nitrogen regulatory protein PII